MYFADPAFTDCTTVYRIDADMIITYVGGHWFDFARRNSPLWPAESVVGHPLSSFIAGIETMWVYQQLIEGVRATGKAVTFNYRCDSADVRRYMAMEISSQADGGIEFASRIIREEARPEQPMLSADAPRSEAYLAVCSWCKKVKTDEDSWCELEDAVALLDLMAVERLPLITHSMCPACFRLMKQSIPGADPGIPKAVD